MDLILSDMQRSTIQTRVILALTHIDHILLHVGCDDEQRFGTTAHA